MQPGSYYCQPRLPGGVLSLISTQIVVETVGTYNALLPCTTDHLSVPSLRCAHNRDDPPELPPDGGDGVSQVTISQSVDMDTHTPTLLPTQPPPPQPSPQPSQTPPQPSLSPHQPPPIIKIPSDPEVKGSKTAFSSADVTTGASPTPSGGQGEDEETLSSGAAVALWVYVAIAAAAIGAVVLLVILVMAAVCTRKKQRRCEKLVKPKGW